MGTGCKWLQLLLTCWASGLFSCIYWFSFTSFLEGSVLHQLITGSSFRRGIVLSCCCGNFPQAAPAEPAHLRGEAGAAAVAPLCLCLLSPFSQPDTAPTTQDATKEDAPHVTSCVGRRDLLIFLPFQASAGWCGSVEQETKWCLWQSAECVCNFYGIVCDPNHYQMPLQRAAGVWINWSQLAMKKLGE